jgi:transposase
VHHRHDINDHTWALLQPHLSERKSSWGSIARSNLTLNQRRTLDTAFSGAPWHLTRVTGKIPTGAPYRWRDRGMWESLLEVFIDQPDYEWLIINARATSRYILTRQGQQGAIKPWAVAKGAEYHKIHLAVDTHGMPLRVVITKGTLDTLMAQAQKGNVYAQLGLGVLNVKGQGVPQDCGQAMQWYHKVTQ